MISNVGAASTPQASPRTPPGPSASSHEIVDERGTTSADAGWKDMQALRVAAATRPAGPPVAGWMKGTVGGAPVDLSFDRRAQTVRGSAFGHTVRVDIDDEQQTVKGEAGGAALDLKRTWTPDAIGLEGDWHGGTLDMTVDWTRGTVRGDALGRSIDLGFNLQAGTVSGTFGGAQVDLQHDAVSGRLHGTLAGRTADVNITNRDLSDFLQNVYLFVK